MDGWMDGWADGWMDGWMGGGVCVTKYICLGFCFLRANSENEISNGFV